MRSLHWGLSPLLFSSILGLVACQGGATAPTDPALPAVIGNQGDLLMAPHADGLPLGSVQLRVDPVGGTVEVQPVRLTSAIGDAYLVGLNALKRNFEITSIRRQAGPAGPQLVLDCAFSHPFPQATRPDLAGWDLKAIVASDHGAFNFPGAGVTLPTTLVANATGYTSEWSPEIAASLPSLTATAFPYIILGEDRTTPPFSHLSPAGWNVFPPESTKTGELVLNVNTSETFDIDIFFTVGYQVSATRQTRQSPDYQPPRGNMRAPWRVDATVTSNTLTSVVGSFATVDLQIWDWQHGQSLGSDVTGITVYAPQLTDTPLTPAIGGGTGRDTDPLTASFSLANSLGTLTTSPAYALVEVRDALDGANPGGGLGEPGISVVEDDFTTIRTIDTFRTWQVIPLAVNINLPGSDPTACVTSTPPLVGGELTVAKNVNVQWDASCSTDPDSPTDPEGMIVGWEWDFDWDGVPANFVDDTAGIGTVAETHSYPVATTTSLGLRVTDGVGRKSPILQVPVTVVDEQFVLTLQPIEDPTFLDESRAEHGAAVVQESDGPIGVAFTGYLAGPGSINTYSSWNGSVWSFASNNYSSSDGLEFGWYAKANPNWVQGNVLALTCWTQFGTHNGIGFSFGYLSPGFNLGYGIPSNYTYGTEVCGHRSDGRIFAFGDEAGQLRCWRGGPDRFDLPVFQWPANPGAVPPTTIDSRPSQVSRVRSAESASDGSVHIAYRSQDRSQLRYAKNAAGDNGTWETQDLVTVGAGALSDPAFSLDEVGGAHIAYTQNLGGGSFQVYLLSSTDLGQTWGTPLAIGDPFSTEPTDVALSVRFIEGYQVIAIGYTTSTHPALSEFRIRWTADGGTEWQDALLSAGADAYSPDLMITRSGGTLLVAWSADNGSGRSNVFVRRGLFHIQ